MGRTLVELDLPEKFGCRAVALERMGQAIAVPDTKMVVESWRYSGTDGQPEGH